MIKLKLKSSGVKNNKNTFASDIEKRTKVIEETVLNSSNIQSEVKKNKNIIPPARKIIYTSKRGSIAIFDSIKLCATIFGVDTHTIRNRIGKKFIRPCKKDWLKGGSINYYND